MGNVPAEASEAADFLGYLDRAGRARCALARRETVRRLRDDVAALVEFTRLRVGSPPEHPRS